MLCGPPGRFDPHPLTVLTALAAILGHVFPAYLRFKGGKAVATATGAFAALDWRAVLIGLLLWAVVFAIWRYVSLASMAAGASLAGSVWLLNGDPAGKRLFLSAFALLAAVLIIARHRANIARLLSGTEPRFGQSDTGGDSAEPHGTSEP